MRAVPAALLLAALAAGPLQAQLANRAVYLDSAGVVRWRDTRQEVSLFGANYVLPTASDYRAAGYVHADRKHMIDEDMAQFARMGWDGMRLTFWGDWEAADSAGNLIANDHLDLLDYLIARARERGIYLLFSPIQLYGSNWPDALADTSAPGFGRRFGKGRMGTDPAAIAAQVNYLHQILEHVNPYTGLALKDEPAIVFIELVNEPWHHPEDLEGSVRYLDTLIGAVRGTGCRKLIFYNVSQDFRIGGAIRLSRVQGLTFGWYPSGLNSGHELSGNYLRAVDAYPDMLRPELARMPRIVYEFDTPDLRTGYLYPALVRTLRAVGTQFAAMFAYDMLQTASRNLGWQTHYLNLVYTPRKAMSAIIAAEAMRRLPRGRTWGDYPQNTTFGDFRVSYQENASELAARDAFLYAGSTRTAPPDPAALRRVAGLGSSAVVRYDGDGLYFLDRVREGLWRLEVYPDAEPVRDPFEAPSPDKIVTRAIARPWPMTVTLPDLGGAFTVQPLAAGGAATTRAEAGRFTVTPGVYLLSAGGEVSVAALPATVSGVGLAEFHAPPDESLPASVVPEAPAALVAGHEGSIAARIVDRTAPDSATLFIRPATAPFWRGVPLRLDAGYRYRATIPAALLSEGPHQYVVTTFRGDSVTTYPGGRHVLPAAWDWYGPTWQLEVTSATTPLLLFDPAADAARLAFSRIGDTGRRGLFRIGYSDATGRAVFHLELPEHGGGPEANDYTSSLVVADRVRARGEAILSADALRLRLRGVGPHQVLHVTLMEDDGTSWTAALPVDSTWSEPSLPLSTFSVGRGVLLPEGFPGEWNYWVGPAQGRGLGGDRPRLDHLERLQLSLRREDAAAGSAAYGVELEWVTLGFRR